MRKRREWEERKGEEESAKGRRRKRGRREEEGEKKERKKREGGKGTMGFSQMGDPSSMASLEFLNLFLRFEGELSTKEVRCSCMCGLGGVGFDW